MTYQLWIKYEYNGMWVMEGFYDTRNEALDTVVRMRYDSSILPFAEYKITEVRISYA